MSELQPHDGNARNAPINVHPDEFREAGRLLVDRISDFLGSLDTRKVTPFETAAEVRQAVGTGGVPHGGQPLNQLLEGAADLLFEHSLLNSHPRFWGYITSSPAPVGILADMLAAAINPNVASWRLAPAATEIEAQTIRWLAELIGYPTDCGGILVSGGNMANFIGFLAARKAKAPWSVREKGLYAAPGQLRVYVSAKTHTWIEKATDLFGLGTDAIRWIDIDGRERMMLASLERQIELDRHRGDVPFLVVGTAGTVGTGAIDPLPEIAEICDRERIWFHIDGAYGALAAMLPDAPAELAAIHRADSIALDPHKWLYAPLEAGCTLVKRAVDLRDAFTFDPEYYTFAGEHADAKQNLFEYGPQNSRGFRALKVWLAIRQVGRDGYQRMIATDMDLARQLYARIQETPELEAVSQSLSITTFRYVPEEFSSESEDAASALNEINRRVLDRIQDEGEAFVSNAVVSGAFVLRACIVNFRTNREDISALPEIVVRTGRRIVEEMKGV